MAYDGGGESGSGDYEDFSTPAFNSGIGSGAPATLAGGDATQANDALTRQKQWGLLGLYGDNGGLSQYGMGLGNGGGSMSQLDPNNPNGFAAVGSDTGQMSSGDSGSGVDYTNQTNNANVDMNSLYNSAGYTGSFDSPNSVGGDSGGQVGVPDYTAANAWMAQNGYQVGNKYGNFDQGDPYQYTNIFDKDGKAVGTQQASLQDQHDRAFGIALAAASAFAGGAAGGQLLAGSGYGAGTAGAASDVGSLGAAGATAGTTVGTGVPAWASAAATGAGAGFGGTAASTGDFISALKGSAVGGLTGGLTAGVNPAGALGVSDPSWARPINSIVNSTARAGLTGQSVGGAALGSLENSGLSAGLQAGYGGLKGMFGDNNSSSGGYSDPYNLQGGGTLSGGLGQYSPAPQSPDINNWLGQDAQGGTSTPAQTPYAGTGPDFTAAGAGQPQPAPNPFKSAIQTALGMGGAQAGGGKSAAPGNFDSMAGNLLQLWQSHRNASQYGGLANNLSSLYGPNSPYAQQLNQALFRQQAASGRRSDVGGRNVQLQAQLAALNSQNAPRLAQLYGAQQNNQGQELQSLLRLGMNPTVQGGISGLWNQYNPFGKPDYNDPGYAAGSDAGNGNGG